MQDATKKEIKRLSRYFKIEVDELISEAWLIEHDNPGISTEDLHRKLNSYCFEINKPNGVYACCDSLDDEDKAIKLAYSSAHSASVVDSMIEASERAEREAKYDQIDVIRAVAGYASAAEMARAIGCSERDARRWLEKQIALAGSQAQMFA